MPREEQAQEISACDIRHTKICFRNISDDKAGCDHIGRNAATAEVVVNPRLPTLAKISKQRHERRVGENLKKHAHQRYAFVLQADDDSQNDNAHDIVNDCRAENRTADLAIQLPHFPQRFYGDADRCRGQHNTDKYSF